MNHLKAFLEKSSRDDFVLDPVKMTTSPDAKYAFVIGSRRITMVSEEQPLEWTTSFKIDVLDLCCEERRTLTLNDLYDFGDYLVHIYALDTNTLILLDYNHRQTTLRQRIVHISANSAFSPLHRCYHYGTSQTSFIKAAVGDQKCAVISRQRFEGLFVALTIPKNPLDNCPEVATAINISHHVNQMNEELNATLSLNVCHYISPFFSCDDRDICFLTVSGSTLCIETTTICCLNLNHRWCTREAKVDEISGFPMDEYEQTPIMVDCYLCQNGNDQVGLIARYRTPIGHWRWRVCNVLQWIQMRFVHLFFFALDVQAEAIGRAILYVTAMISYCRDRLVLRPNARLGILNLKSWVWLDHTHMLRDIHYVDQLTDLASHSGQIVSFISQTGSDNNCEQSVRVGRSSGSMLPLMTIADYELRRSGDPNLHRIRHNYLKHVLSVRTLR